MLIRRLLPIVVMLISGAVQACGCSPDSPVFHDAFFKYCDEARATHEATAPFAGADDDRDRFADRAENDQQGEPVRSTR